MTFNRTDNDGHKFNVPETELAEFDRVFAEYTSTKFLSEAYYDLQAEFCNKFDQYMVG